jgi:hypothetical protein
MAVLLVSGISVCHVTVAMATEFETVDMAVKYLHVADRPHQQLAVLLGTHCIVCSIFLCLECKEVDKTFRRHVTPLAYENCVVLFIAVLCSSYRICVSCCIERNDGE